MSLSRSTSIDIDIDIDIAVDKRSPPHFPPRAKADAALRDATRPISTASRLESLQPIATAFSAPMD